MKSVCEAKCGDDPSSMFVVWELYHLIDDDTEVEVPGFANKTRTGNIVRKCPPKIQIIETLMTYYVPPISLYYFIRSRHR